MKKITLSLLIILLFFSIVTVVNAGKDAKKEENKKEEVTKVSCDKQVTVHLFWGNGCPHCEAAIEYFDSIKDTYGDCFKLEKYETWHDADGKKLLEDVASYFGEDVRGVPYIVIGEDTFSGYSSTMNEKLENAITSNAKSEEYVDAVEKVKNGDTGSKSSSTSDTIVTIVIMLVAGLGIGALIKTSRTD